MKFEFSAGGVIFKKSAKGYEILVCQHAQHHGWVFPKGLIGDNKKNETKEEAAAREVEEEAGVQTKIIKELEPVAYWYMWEGEKIKKTVYYFLMEFTGGNITKHDHEMEQVEFIPQEEVSNRLTYPSDKKIWEIAQKMLP